MNAFPRVMVVEPRSEEISLRTPRTPECRQVGISCNNGDAPCSACPKEDPSASSRRRVHDHEYPWQEYDVGDPKNAPALPEILPCLLVVHREMLSTATGKLFPNFLERLRDPGHPLGQLLALHLRLHQAADAENHMMRVGVANRGAEAHRILR